MNIGTILIEIIVQTIISAPALWLAGRWRVGIEKAKFTDAVMITALGVVANVVINQMISGGIGAIIQLGVYLYLVKKYYETDYVNSAIIAILTVAILFFVTLILAMVGIAIIGPSIAGIV